MKTKIFMLVLVCLFILYVKADGKFLDIKAKKFSSTSNIIEVNGADIFVVLIVALVLYHFVFIILCEKIVRDDIFYFFPLPTD